MILADRTIRRELEKGGITIEPFDLDQLQPCSYDLRLGNLFQVFEPANGRMIDPEQDNSSLMQLLKVNPDGRPFRLGPGGFALAMTYERIGVDARHVAVLNGKSSLARLGLVIHATAGFIDPGNCLNITLELVNTAPMPILLRPGMKIAQVVFQELTQECERPYGSPGLNSKYVGSTTVQGSLMHLNYPSSGVYQLPLFAESELDQ